MKQMPVSNVEPRRVKASYDAASNSPDNAAHWQYSNGYSADVTNDPYSRRRIRNRARFEVLENNAYGRGMVETLAQDTIGTGPRLQLHTDDEAVNTEIEREFSTWARAINLAQKLRQMKTAKTVDGEAVAKLVTNPRVPHPITLDVELVEADRLASPEWGIDRPDYVDGVHLDPMGNPVAYDILRHHPGGNEPTGLLEYNTLDRSRVLHWFRRDRPEQHRGVSEFATSLEVFAIMRRYTMSVLTASETAANHAVVIQTGAPMLGPDTDGLGGCGDDGGSEEAWQAGDLIPLSRNDATVLPEGSSIGQFKPEHPHANYEAFQKHNLSYVARGFCMPYGIAAADSSGYNYSSGRLDHQVYDRALRVEQCDCSAECLDRIFGEWLMEAALFGIIPAAIASQVLQLGRMYGGEGASIRVPHSWAWDRRQHVDPGKEATAQRLRITNGTTSRELELRDAGFDIDEVDASSAAGLGLSLEEYRKRLTANLFPVDANSPPAALGDPDGGDDDDETDDESADDSEE